MKIGLSGFEDKTPFSLLADVHRTPSALCQKQIFKSVAEKTEGFYGGSGKSYFAK